MEPTILIGGWALLRASPVTASGPEPRGYWRDRQPDSEIAVNSGASDLGDDSLGPPGF